MQITQEEIEFVLAEREQLILENQLLHYQNMCRRETLLEHGIQDPFARQSVMEGENERAINRQIQGHYQY